MNKRIITYLAIFIQLILVADLISAQPALSQSQKSFDVNSFRTTVDSLLEEKKIPGAGISIVHKDSVIWSGGIGHADYEQKTPVTSEHLFRIGSISKTFVAMGIMRLVEEDKLSLDDEVQDFVPEIRIDNPWRDTDPIRIKHLLGHTAGFDDMHFNEMYNTTKNPNISLRKALSINPKSREVRWKPGARFSYSNPGYTVAGYIIEKVTSQSYDAYLQEKILEPLGMSESSFAYTDSVEKKLVTGYGSDYESVEYHSIYLRPAGMLHSSPKDMAKFVRLLLNDGSLNGTEIITEDSMQRMEVTETTLAGKKGFKNGYGLGMNNGVLSGYPNINHTGAIDGFTAQYLYFPSYDLGFVLLVNSTSGFRDIREVIIDFLMQDIPKPEPEPIVKVRKEQLRKYEGYYAHRSPRNQLFMPLHVLLDGISLEVSEDALRMSEFMDSAKSLLPVAENSFREENKTSASTHFIDTKEYGSVMQHNGSFYVKTGSWKKYVYRSAFLGGLGILSIFLLFSIFWIPFEGYRKYSSKYSPLSYQSLFWWPFSAICSIVLLMFAASQLELITIGEFTVSSMLFTVATYLFGICSLGSLWTSIQGWKKDVHIGLKTYFTLTSVTLVGFTFFLIYWGWMGIRLWAY